MSFLDNIHSLPESTRKKILVVWVGVSMILVSFIWFSAMKSKLATTQERSADTQIKEVQRGVLDNIDTAKLQGSVYQTTLDETLKNLEEDKENTDNSNIDNSEEENTEYVEDETELGEDSVLFENNKNTE